MTKAKRNKQIWNVWIKNKYRLYLDAIILICGIFIVSNIHPYNPNKNLNTNWVTKSEMTYIFHDYEWNQYILNNYGHGSSDSRDYLFDDSVPETLQNEDITEIDLWNELSAQDDHNTSNMNDKNQVSYEDIVNELWIDEDVYDYEITTVWNHDISEGYSKDNSLTLNLSELAHDENNTYYVVHRDENSSALIIERKYIDQEEWWDEITIGWIENFENWKNFTFVLEWRILPTIISREELWISAIEYKDWWNTWIYSWNNTISSTEVPQNQSEKGVVTIDEYANCKTPRWYYIKHGESVLAYQQLKNAPDICNIERRFCRNGKLSWTYTQQWCSINENYTYAQRWEVQPTEKNPEYIPDIIQNEDWTVTVNNKEIWSDFVFDKPSSSSTSRYSGNNLREPDKAVNQTKRVYRDCTAPRWETVKHGQFVQAFKHANGFSDAPCEAQLRLCTMWDLWGTFTESSCKTRDTSFIDWINGSPTRKTYSQEKLERVKKRIKAEQVYDVDYGRLTNSEALDQILAIMEE